MTISTQHVFKNPCPELQQARSGMRAIASQVGGGCTFSEISGGDNAGLYLYKDTNGNGKLDVGADEVMAYLDTPDCDDVIPELMSLGKPNYYSVPPQQAVDISRMASDSSYQNELANWIKNKSD